ncbi:hypothetical protein VTG60DRAFT_2287 [Thermothelomyces hinnuleus]
MKTTITAIFAVAGAATVAAVDFPSNMPDCGRLCGTNMFGKAAELGCQENDIACLCRNKDFGFGIRDCSIQVCDSVDQANVAIDWGNSLCAGVNVPANIPSATSVAGPTGGSGSSAPVTSSGEGVVTTITSGDSTFVTTVSTGAGSGESSESGGASAITTSTWTSTLSSDSGTTTVTGETTITGTGGAGGATSESTVTSPFVSTRTDGTSVSETTIASTTFVTSATGVAQSSNGQGPEPSSTTSSAQAAQMTAAPALGALAAAGIAFAFF